MPHSNDEWGDQQRLSACTCSVTGNGSRSTFGRWGRFALAVALALSLAIAITLGRTLRLGFGRAFAAVDRAFSTAFLVVRLFAVGNIPTAPLKMDRWTPHPSYNLGAMATDTSRHTAIGKRLNLLKLGSTSLADKLINWHCNTLLASTNRTQPKQLHF
jgi:hypothetical protein